MIAVDPSDTVATILLYTGTDTLCLADQDLSQATSKNLDLGGWASRRSINCS